MSQTLTFLSLWSWAAAMEAAKNVCLPQKQWKTSLPSPRCLGPMRVERPMLLKSMQSITTWQNKETCPRPLLPAVGRRALWRLKVTENHVAFIFQGTGNITGGNMLNVGKDKQYNKVPLYFSFQKFTKMRKSNHSAARPHKK